MRSESKAELMDRLRREGRWDAFVQRREALKASSTDAGDAWRIAATEFPALIDDNENDGKTDAPPDLVELRDKPAVPMLDAVQWVFDTIDADWIIPANAPSVGAWSLRDWARRNAANRANFYATFAAKMMPSRSQLDERPPNDDGRKLIGFIDEMRASAETAKRDAWSADRSLARAILVDELCPACRSSAETRGIA